MEGSLYVSVESGDASASEVNLNLESVSTFRAGCVTGDFLNSGIKSKLEFVSFKVWGPSNQGTNPITTLRASPDQHMGSYPDSLSAATGQRQ